MKTTTERVLKGELKMPQELGLVSLYRGEQFSILHPESSEFDIMDIAHSLSHICRFNGHSKFFYSVAQHSLAVKEMIRIDGYGVMMQLYGLTHDVSEFVCADLQSTIKSCLSGYREIEDSIENAFYKAYGILPPADEERAIVKEYDNMALFVESKNLMNGFNRMRNVKDYGVLNYPIMEEGMNDVREKFFWSFYKLLWEMQKMLNEIELAECV